MKKNQNKKYFIITIDTEGDNQWDTTKGISTLNVKYLPRFQESCEKYGYKPVWLANYEMVNDPEFVRYMKPKQVAGLCEIGMHLHAWHSPPEYRLTSVTNHRDYLTEYPENIMSKKIETLTNNIKNKFDIQPVSHRSGRWAMNSTYFKLLEQFGYKVDCSVTPFVSWEKFLGKTGMPGSDYSSVSTVPYKSGNILEVPMTIRNIHIFDIGCIKRWKNILGEFNRLCKGRKQWLRPDKSLSLYGISRLMDVVSKENTDYMMFMLHSSELMPGGSPNFPDKESIEKLYKIIDKIFAKAQILGYEGITLKNYYKEHMLNVN